MADVEVAAASASISDLDSHMMFTFWVSTLVGVYIYIDGNNDLVYKATTDGGVTFGSAVVIHTGTVVNLDCYYAQNNPALQSSFLVHMQYTDSTAMHYRTLDASSLVLGTERTVVTDADMSSTTQYGNFISVARNGDIMCALKVNGGTIMCYRSTDSGANWTSRATPWVGESSTDNDRVYHVTSVNTDDTADHAILFDDIGSNELSIKVYDSSGNVWNETVIGTLVESGAGVGSHQVSNVTRQTNGHVMVVAANNLGSSALNDINVWDLTITSSAASGVTVTALTNVLTDTQYLNNVSAVYDPAGDDVYVAYCLGAGASELDNIVYRRTSTDWGTTWSSATQYSAGSSGGGVGYQQLGITVLASSGGVAQWMFWLSSTTAIYINTDNDVPLVATPTVTLTGTIVPTATEDMVAAGGLTLIATVTNGTWASTIDDDATTSEDFISALVSATSQTLGWNNVVVGKFYRKEVLADSPLNYLRLGGNVTDLGSVGQNGTATALTVGSPLLLNSSQASSVFNAATAKVALSSPAGLDNLWDGGGTAEIILRPWASGFSLDQSKLYSKVDGGAGWELILDNQSGGFVDVSLRVDFSTTQGVWKVAHKIPIGLQTHLAVTYDSGATTNVPVFYINGSPHTPVTETTPVGTRSSDASSNLWIGSNSSAAVTFNGELQESALYATSLSATRIQAHVLAASTKYGLTYTALARTSATVITLTMPAFPFYDIGVLETITATFPTTVFTLAPSSSVVATPTFNITPTTRKTAFTPPPNLFGPNGGGQTTGPFGNVNGGLGPHAGDAFRILGAGDTWTIGIPQMAIGLAGTVKPRVLLIRATEITEVDESA